MIPLANMEHTGVLFVPEEITEPEYQLKHLDPETDRALLEAVALDPAAVDTQWMEELDSLMDAGSSTIANQTTTVQQREIAEARTRYAQRLGLDNPNHALHDAYRAALELRSNGLAPTKLFDTLRSLTGIAGGAPGAIGLVARAPYLLLANHRTLSIRYKYLQRLAARLGWTADIQKLVLDKPEVLVVGSKKVAALGRIAAKHASADQQSMDADSVARMITKSTIESHLRAIVRNGKSYVFGQKAVQTNYTVQRQRQELYGLLKKRSAVTLIGRDVLKAYFRHRPPNSAALKQHPHLRALLPTDNRASNVESTSIFTSLAGHEPWLEEIGIPPTGKFRRDWFVSINRHIAGGSVEMHQKGKPEAYEEILDHRIRFFRALGWSNPKHVLGKVFEGFLGNRPALVPPDRVVGILNLLSSYNVTPVETVVKSCFWVFACTVGEVQARIEVIVEEGFDVNEVLQQAPSLLRKNRETIRQKLPRTKAGKARRSAGND